MRGLSCEELNCTLLSSKISVIWEINPPFFHEKSPIVCNKIIVRGPPRFRDSLGGAYGRPHDLITTESWLDWQIGTYDFYFPDSKTQRRDTIWRKHKGIWLIWAVRAISPSSLLLCSSRSTSINRHTTSTYEKPLLSSISWLIQISRFIRIQPSILPLY